MTAVLTIRPGTRDHTLEIAGRVVQFREQSRAHKVAGMLAAAGAADAVDLIVEEIR